MQDSVVKQPNKAIKITKITLTVIFYIFIALLLIFSISTLRENKNEENPKLANIFGTGFMVVVSDSMETADGKGIYKDDLILVRTLSTKDKLKLEKGDIVTFFDPLIRNTDGSYGAFNTHRIDSDPVVDLEAETIRFYTRGDNPKNGQDNMQRTENDIVAIYKGSRIAGLGIPVAFMQTQLGFGLLVILPVLLMLGWNGYVLMKNVFAIKNEQMKESNEAEKEKMKQELLEQLRREQQEVQATKDEQ